MRHLQPAAIIRPFLWQIECPIDEGMTVPRHIGGEHPDLAVRDLTCRARVLARNSARGLALFQKAGFVDNKNRVSIGQRFQCILTHNIAQCMHPIVLGPGSPAGATGLDRRPLPPASNPSCAVRCPTVHREIVQPTLLLAPA
jgi:hypothetical protein